MAAFFVLDAAEHGVFVPGAEQVFEDADEEPDWCNGDDGFQEDDDSWQDDEYDGYDDYQ